MISIISLMSFLLGKLGLQSVIRKWRRVGIVRILPVVLYEEKDCKWHNVKTNTNYVISYN